MSLTRKPTGRKVNGKQVWASTVYGVLVMFAENEDAERLLEQTITEDISPKGRH